MQNSTQSEIVQGWVSTNCGRGTIDIIWSCLATILICSWTVLHLDVPTPEQTDWNTIRTKALSMIVIVILPESLITASVRNFVGARNESLVLRRLGVKHRTLTHGFFLDMGGFVLRSPHGDLATLTQPDLCKFADAGGMNDRQRHEEHIFEPRGDSSSDLDLASACLRADWLHELRNIDERAIKKVARSDGFAKLFACGQAMWLFTQVISRAVQDLTISQLELATLGFVAFALVSYGVWWKKPQDCTGPIIIQCASQESFEVIQRVLNHQTISITHVKQDGGHEIKEATDYKGGISGVFNAFRPLFRTHWPQPTIDVMSIALSGIILFLGISCILGAIHLIAWNFYFPTEIERWLWRVSALALIVLPCFWFPYVWLVFFHGNKVPAQKKKHRWVPHPAKHWILWVWPLSLFIVFCVARLFLIIELFVSLRSLPVSTYTAVDWSSFLPHI